MPKGEQYNQEFRSLIGQLIRNRREAYPTHGRKLSVAELANLLTEHGYEISAASLYKAEEGKGPVPPELIEAIDNVLGHEPPNTLTLVYNELLSRDKSDSAERSSKEAARVQQRESRRIIVSAARGGGSQGWTVRGNSVKIEVDSWTVAGNRVPIELPEDLAPFERGMVLLFEPERVPLENRYLLFESEIDPNLRIIRYISPDDRSKLRAPSSPDIPRSGWRVVASGVGWMTGPGLRDVNTRHDGIGPTTRVF